EERQVVAETDLERVQVAERRAVREEIEDVGVGPRSGEHADRPRIPLGVVAGPLQGLPRALEKQALLRIDDLGLTRAETEKGRVEEVGVFQAGGGTDERRVVGRRRAEARGLELSVPQEGDRFDALAQ